MSARTPGRLTVDDEYLCREVDEPGMVGDLVATVRDDTGKAATADAEHIAACWNASEDVGGDPATVRELVEALRACEHALRLDPRHDDVAVTCEVQEDARHVAEMLLARIPKARR